MEHKEFYIWLAGFVDGEGCIAMYKKGGSIVCNFHITNTCEEVIVYIKNMLQCGSVSTFYQKTGCKTCYRFGIYDRCGVVAMCKKLLPYLKVKRLQAEIIIEWFDAKVHYENYGTYKDVFDEICFMDRIGKLNRRGVLN